MPASTVADVGAEYSFLTPGFYIILNSTSYPQLPPPVKILFCIPDKKRIFNLMKSITRGFSN